MPLTEEQLVERFNSKQPPTGPLFGMTVLGVDQAKGVVRMSFEPGEHLTNPRGTIQGGIITAMLDDCAAYAGIVALGEPGFIASLEVKTSFLSPAFPGLLFAEGRCLNKIGLHLNPNLFTWNCLTEWRFDGCTAFGEDHDNWTAAGARRFFRRNGGA